jgi:hypothetical protein
VTRAVDTPAHQPPVSTRNAPTALDLAAIPTMEGLAQRTLSEVCKDLFSSLEESLVADRHAFVEGYFATLVKQDEMATLWADPAYYEFLRTVVQKEVLPLYDRYRAVREQMLERTEQRSWPRCCLWTIGICLGLEVLFTEGRVLRPITLLPTVLLDGLLGFGIFYLVSFREASALKRAKKNLLHSIREIEARHEVAKRYEVFRAYTGGELLTAELDQLLGSYHAPAEFWEDYYAVRKADPTTLADLERLGIKRFHSFLELHINGTYSREARQQRYDALFLLAHKLFLLNDREHYVLDHLGDKLPKPK